MTSVLASLGLGAPNPAAYSDAAAVASQQKQAISGLQNTMATISSASSLLKGAGVSSTALDKLNELNKRGDTLLSKVATMSPADLTKEAAALSAEYMVEQYNAIKVQYEKTLSDTTAIAAKINTRVEEIKNDTTTSNGLLSKYETLLSEVNDSVKLLNSSPPFYIEDTEPVLSNSSGSSGSAPKAKYVIPTVPSMIEYQDKLDTLDGLKEEEEGGGFTFSRIFRKFKNWVSLYLYTAFFAIIILSSMILGGIISSNAYVDVESMYLPNRIFYFVYGALGFPLSILAGCIKPPFWVAGLFPAYARAHPKPVQSGGVFDINLPTTVTGNTIALLQEKAVSSLEKAKLIPTGSADKSGEIATAATATQGAPSSSTDIQGIKPGTPFKESGTNVSTPSLYDFFSFVLVDSKNPPKYQVDSKKKLWYLSLAHGIALIGFLVSYKIDL